MKTFGVIIYCCFLLHVDATSCMDRWVAFEGSCYLFGRDLVNFTQAEQYCRRHSGSLVHVESKEENRFLQDFLRVLKSNEYWIGMTDEAVEGEWKWYGTDTLVRYFDWGPSEPQNYTDEDCVIFGNFIDRTWADVRCATSRKALCEMPTGGINSIIG